MPDESILQIVVQAKDEASKKIKEIGDYVEGATKKMTDMSTSFKIAGGVMLGVGIAGVGVMKNLADAAAQHQVSMASVNETLKNVSSSLETQTVIIGGNTNATSMSKKEIQAHIQALQLQKQQLTLNNMEQTTSVKVTTGHGATLKEHTKIVHENKDAINQQKMAIDQQIITLKAQELGLAQSGGTQTGVTKIIDNATYSFKQLQKTTADVADSYLRLGFTENDTSLAFAQDLRVTKDVTNAKYMLSTAADLARLKNISLQDATDALTRAYEGSTKVLKSLGIEVDKGAKGMDVLKAVQGATAGQAQAFAHSYEGAMQILNVEFEKLRETLGERLLPSMTSFVEQIHHVIEWLNSFNPKMYDTIVSVLAFGTAFSLIAGPILLAIGFLPELKAGFLILQSVLTPALPVLAAVALVGYLIYTNWKYAEKAFSEIKPYIDRVVQVFERIWTEVQPKLQSFFSWLNDIIVQKLKIAWDILKEDIKGVVKEFEKIWTEVKPKLEPFLKWLVDDIGQKLKIAWNDFKIGVQDVIKGLQRIFTEVEPKLKDFVKWLIGDLENFGKDAAPKAKAAIKEIIDKFQEIWNDVYPKLKAFWDWLKGDLEKFAAEVAPKLKAAWDAIKKDLRELSDIYKAHWREFKIILEGTFGAILVILIVIWEAIKAVIKIALDVIAGNWKGVWGDILGFFIGIWNDIDALTGRKLSAIANNIKKAIDDIKKFFTDLGATVTGIFTGIVEGVKSMVSGIIDHINGLIKSANSVASKIHLPNIPEIKKYDQGGYVPQTGIAMLHQGEFVLSKDMLAGKQPAPSYVNNTTRNTPINIYVTATSEMDFAKLGNQIAFAVRNSR